MTEIAAAKKALRSSLSKVCLSPKDNEIMRERLFAMPEWKIAGSVFVYVSVPPEPDTRRIIEAALFHGKRVTVPKIFGNGHMKALEIYGLNDLCEINYNIPEPQSSAPEFDSPELIIVPCLACDRHKNRLGHGGGYYDRYLKTVTAPKICLCPHIRLLESLPHCETDVKMDTIITEREII